MRRVPHGMPVTLLMTPRPDPFTDAACREPSRLVRWWDEDARPDERALAATLCRRCPALLACAEAADALGTQASGTWAAQYRRWELNTDLDDEAMAEYLAVFGPSATNTDNPMPTTQTPKPTRHGRYWIHPAQLRLKYQEAN